MLKTNAVPSVVSGELAKKALLRSAFMFGGIGAIISAHICHHKTRKWYFQVVWWIGVILDVLIIVFILKSK
jgi:uncharacterized membrane protein YsdA (DUF1294 family)